MKPLRIYKTQSKAYECRFLFLLLNALPALADDSNFCDETTKAAQKACTHELKDDDWIDVGNCNNVLEIDAHLDCIIDAKAATVTVTDQNQTNTGCHLRCNY